MYATANPVTAEAPNLAFVADLCQGYLERESSQDVECNMSDDSRRGLVYTFVS